MITPVLLRDQNRENLAAALTEIDCGSYDGYVQGLNILGSSFIHLIYPEASDILKKFRELQKDEGSESIHILMIQKKLAI